MIRRLLADQTHRERIAVIEGAKEIRYIDLIQKAWAIQPLLPRGQQGNIAILLPNGGDYIAAFWGTVMAGLTAFPLNVLMTGHEIIPLLRQASVSVVITTTAYRRLLGAIPEAEALSLKFILMDEVKTAAVEHEYASVDVDADKPMLLLGTSGTTGKAKIVQLSEKNVEASVLGYLDKLSSTEADVSNFRYTIAVPFSSAYGMMIVCACLMRSFPIVILDHTFTLDALFLAAQTHKITHYEGSASTILLMERMAGRAIPYDIQTLKYFGFGGSKISGSIIEKAQRAYPGMGFYQGYGMTEASPLIAKHPQAKLQKADSVGTAIHGVEIAVETENGIISTPYTKGEIVVRGPNVMLGYLENEPETNRVLKNGYLYTGDIGYLDDEEYLYICGRKKNIIIVRGFNVYPEDVEECILSSRLAIDCFVYGQEDDYGNEMVCADIIPMHPQISEEQIRLYCNAHLAQYKRPQKISLCKFIRKNASGKTERH